MKTKKEKAAESNAKVEETIHIAPPNIKKGEVWIIGNAPLVMHKFSDKAKNMMREKQAAGTTANTKKGNRAAKDFDALFEGARHRSFEGWDGIPAAAFRNACIDACRLVNYKMTMAKMSVVVEADGFDATEGTPLVKIIGGEPRKLESMVRLATGVCDISVRPQWLEWGARIRFKYDADQFTANDVVNLIARAGMQVGICEGRPFSKNSNGMGWGTFEISDEKTVMALLKKGGKRDAA